jgi:putative ABC transport system permease protein
MAEVDLVMFARDIPAYAYLFAMLLTVCFTLLVNVILYPKINRIDMASALKAVE